MENASKAMLMASGILFALLTISLLTVMFRNIDTINGTQDDEKQLQELRAWNAEWEAYNKQIMYGAEVLTVVNKAKQVNEYSGQIEVTCNVLDLANHDMMTDLKNHKKSIFECKSMKYSNATGKVNEITFKLIKDLRNEGE